MELNIPYPDAKNLPDAFGITEERQQELADALENLWNSVGRDPVKMRWHHLVADIAFFCRTTEELAHCLVVECAWLQQAGRRIA